MEQLTGQQVQSGLEAIVEYFGGIPDGSAVKFWEDLSAKLSRIAGKDPAWTWRYPHGVYAGTTQPSRKFSAAVMALGAALDEVPTVLAYTVQVRVFARPDTVNDGSLVMGNSKRCARPGCQVIMVPNVPWRKYCSDECARVDKKLSTNGNGRTK